MNQYGQLCPPSQAHVTIEAGDAVDAPTHVPSAPRGCTHVQFRAWPQVDHRKKGSVSFFGRVFPLMSSAHLHVRPMGRIGTCRRAGEIELTPHRGGIARIGTVTQDRPSQRVGYVGGASPGSRWHLACVFHDAVMCACGVQ